jgi:hypothetical protein
VRSFRLQVKPIPNVSYAALAGIGVTRVNVDRQHDLYTRTAGSFSVLAPVGETAVWGRGVHEETA